MRNYLGERIYQHRGMSGMTQDQYGAKYGVSGPAIFKFEKGYVKPSLVLWLKMARDFNISERQAVLLWVKSKLPDEYQDFIEIKEDDAVAEEPVLYNKETGKIDYTGFSERARMRESAMQDNMLPRGLKNLLQDDEIWAAYKPTGREINMLRDNFAQLGEGSKSSYRESLRLLRNFSGAE